MADEIGTIDRLDVQSISIGSGDLGLDDVYRILFEGVGIELCASGIANLAKPRDLLKEHTSDHIVYGVNTGFGPMASHRISEESHLDLQMNLIRSHALGTGSPIAERFVRATMLCRLVGFMKGFSGVSDELVTLLRDFLNHGIYPVIPEHGVLARAAIWFNSPTSGRR